MALSKTRCHGSVVRILLAWLAGHCLAWNAAAPCYAQELEISEEFQEFEGSASIGESPFGPGRSIFDKEEVPAGDAIGDEAHVSESEADSAARFTDPNAAKFGEWKPIIDGEDPLYGKDEHLRPFDWMRHVGFHHSSTEGRHTDKNVPLSFSSWLNRPFHFDWFAGPLLSDSPNRTAGVKQTNELFGGLRFGWDFDYYWGTEWRFGWADPQIFYEGSSDRQPGQYFVSDVNLVYYPWGDTKVRPFVNAGLGVSQIGALHNDGGALEATLLGMPFGFGVQFKQTPWLAWRAEITDNLAWGSEGVSTTHNVSFTAGMDLRFGARTPSYWPWRTARRSW